MAVLTTSNRFFVVNNIKEPRVRRFFDIDLPHPGVSSPPSWPWAVLAFERHARILCGTDGRPDLVLISLSEASPIRVPVGGSGDETKITASHISVSADNSKVGVLFSNGQLILGESDLILSKQTRTKLDYATNVESITEMSWIGNDAVVLFAPDSSQCILVCGQSVDKTFLAGFVTSVPELDCVRIFSLYSQEIVRCVPQTLQDIFAIGKLGKYIKIQL